MMIAETSSEKNAGLKVCTYVHCNRVQIMTYTSCLHETAGVFFPEKLYIQCN